MGAVRNARLDEHCETIGESLDREASARTTRKGEFQAAQPIMRKLGIGRYQHAGVLVTLTPGTDKISAKRVKEEGNASAPIESMEQETAGDESAGQGEGDAGEGAEV